MAIDRIKLHMFTHHTLDFKLHCVYIQFNAAYQYRFVYLSRTL
jgi:hypothetical protein